jgi:integrase
VADAISLSRQGKDAFVGAWPDASLSDARAKRDTARRDIAAGVDPAEKAKLERLNAVLAVHNSFEAIAEEWHAKNQREGLAPITLRKTRWLLDMAYPTLRNRPIAAIIAQEVLLVLRKVEATGRHESARRMRSVLSRVFRYAIATARAERDIAVDLRGAITTPKVKHMAAITTATAAGGLLRAIEGYQGHAITTYALKLTPHVFVRPGELRKWEWAEIDFGKAIWNIPADKMKMRRPHSVPLSQQVCSLLEELHDLTGDGRYLFPSFRTRDRSMSENTVNAALRSLGYGPDQMTAHGFRAMAATLLNELGLFSPDAIERQLAHLDASVVRRAYTRGEYWDERVRMMQHWSDYIDTLREETKVARPLFGRRKPALADHPHPTAQAGRR